VPYDRTISYVHKQWLFPSLKHLNRPLGPPSLLYNEYRVFPREYGLGLTLTSHIHLAPWFKMSGAIPLIPLYAFMAWRERDIVFFPFYM